MNSERERPRTISRIWVRTALSLVLVLVAGISTGQAAQRHQPRHETEIGICFASPDKLVHLIGAGEVVQCLRRGFAKRFPRAVQTRKDFPDGNQAILFTLHGLFPCSSDKTGEN